MNIVEAFDGPFAAWLGDPDDWQPWRTFLKTLSAAPLTEDERPLFERCTGRSKPFTAPPSEAWVVVGRRGRKSAIAAVLGVHSAVHVDWSVVIAPGETARVIVVAVDKSQARIVRSYAEAILRSDPDLERLIVATDQESITLANGIVVQCVANSFRSIRGPAVVAAIFEELAFWRSDESAVPDKEVLRAVRPSMLTTKKHGALLIGISSPYAKRGLLYEKHRDHFGDDDSNVLVWQADTQTMNPSVDAEEIEAAYRDDPSASAAEFGALFRDDLQAFLDADLLAKLTRTSPLELPPRTGIQYIGFVDPSGGRGDAMTLSVGHRDDDGHAIIDLVRAVPAPFDPATATADFAATLKEYGLREVTGDAYSGSWVSEAFAEHGIDYHTSPLNKSAIYLESLPAFTRGEVELPDHRQLLTELASLERRTARGGKDSVDHPPRGHDDLANAVCGVIVNAAQPVAEPRRMPRIDNTGLTSTPDQRQEMRNAKIYHGDDGDYFGGTPGSINADILGWSAPAGGYPDEAEHRAQVDPDRLTFLQAYARYGPSPAGARWSYDKQRYEYSDGRIARRAK